MWQTGPSAGNINVKEFDDVTLSKLSTANGSISFTADGNITVPNSGDGVVVSGTGNISLTANGTASSFTANDVISTANGEVSITATKDVVLGANGDISSTGNASVVATTAASPLMRTRHSTRVQARCRSLAMVT